MNDYKTKDLALAAALNLEFPIKGIELIGQGKSEFVFEEGPDLRNSVSNYWEGNLRVDPLQYFEKLRSIKTRMYESQQGITQ